MFEFPDGDRALRRRYTIRRSDPAECIADFEIEVHDGRGLPLAGQPRYTWASASRPSHPEAGSACVQRRRPISSSLTTPRCRPPSSCSKRSAGSPATDLLVTSHGSNSRPTQTGALETSLVWMRGAVTLEMLSELHLADGTAAYLFGERQPADSTPKQKDMRLWMSVVSGARLGSRLGSSDPERLCAWYAELGETALSAPAVLLDALDVGRRVRLREYLRRSSSI